MRNFTIPKLSSRELAKRYKRIKPIVQIQGVKYYLREYKRKELSQISYSWDKYQDRRELVDMSQYTYREEDNFECLHTYKHYGCFCPTIAEVLAQIPEKLLDKVSAFEIIAEPKTVFDFFEHAEEYKAGYLVSTVRLYRSVCDERIA